MKQGVLELSEDEINRFVVPYNNLLKKEHPLLWKLNYIGLKSIYNLLRNIIPPRKYKIKNNLQ